MAQVTYPLGAGIPAVVHSVVNTVTISELNAGKVILAADATKTLTVVDFTVIAAGGSLGGATDLRIGDTAGTPVVVGTVAAAAATVGAICKPETANVTVTTFGAPLTAGKGLQVYKTGSTATTSTSFLVNVLYTVN